MSQKIDNEFYKNVDWESAINFRRSVRSYEMQPLGNNISANIDFFIAKKNFPFSDSTEIRRFRANCDKKLYTVFASPPDNIAFIAPTDLISISKAGFVGELFILYATSLGLATCWYGHYNLAELEKLLPHLGNANLNTLPRWGYGKESVDGKRAICISPLGYWEERGLRLVDRMQNLVFSHRRKPLNELLENDSLDKLPPEIHYALDLARKAPSGANSQHWRFCVSEDYREILMSMPRGYKHIKWEHPEVDLGICASHIWLGLKIKGINCSIDLFKEDDRIIWSFRIQNGYF